MNSFEQIYNQSIGFLLCSTRYSFVLLKGLEPKRRLMGRKEWTGRHVALRHLILEVEWFRHVP